MLPHGGTIVAFCLLKCYLFARFWVTRPPAVGWPRRIFQENLSRGGFGHPDPVVADRALRDNGKWIDLG